LKIEFLLQDERDFVVVEFSFLFATEEELFVIAIFLFLLIL